MLIALEPTKIPRTMKIVAGFQALDLGCAGSEASRRRNALGTRERHSEGFATRGRCEVPSCRRLDVVKVLCGILVDCRAHCEQMLSVCLKAFEGAMMPVFRSRCRNNSEAADRRIETRLEG
jgi:hypothetical protein